MLRWSHAVDEIVIKTRMKVPVEIRTAMPFIVSGTPAEKRIVIELTITT
ncbi:MAG: hypothetical protein KAU23_10865 [Anaerolineales bacterium]|nr:hypothetical protein [Anaerolineales bacterium]